MRLVEENFGATQSKASNLAGREPEVGQAHFSGTRAYRAGLALLAQPRASASRREYYYLPHRSLATPAGFHLLSFESRFSAMAFHGHHVTPRASPGSPVGTA